MDDHSTGRRWLRLSLLALVLALGACMETRALEDALSKQYGEAVVGFANEDRTALEVTFLASPFVGRPDADRRMTARKAAEYVRDHYQRYKALDKVMVRFTSRKEFLAVSPKDIAASYTFTRADLGPPQT